MFYQDKFLYLTCTISVTPKNIICLVRINYTDCRMSEHTILSTIEDKIQIILRQTDYTEEVAREKLTLHDFDEIKCIKEYLGVGKQNPVTVKKSFSLNQQIYKEIRGKLAGAPPP